MTSVLFLCDDNAVSSVMAESILRSVGGARFSCHSAGVRPAAAVHPRVLDFLLERSMPVSGLRTKPMRDVASSRFDFVITLSELAEDEGPGRWEGDPVLAHWTVLEGDEPLNDATVRDAFWALQRRIKIFASLPLAGAPRRSIQSRVEAIATWQ